MTTPTGILFSDPRVKPLSTTGTQQAGCYLQFYLTGTTTLANVYADAGLTTPLNQTPGAGGNSTTAASDGRFVAIYLDPSVTYRVQLYTSLGVLLEDTDPYVVPSSSIISPQGVGKAIYPQSPAEIAASVTPTDYTYPPFNVKRYGAKGDGVTDDTTAIQTAVNVLNNWTTYSTSIGKTDGTSPDMTRGGTVNLPGGVYIISLPILLAPGITLQGACQADIVGSSYAGDAADQTLTTIRANFPGGHNWYVIDSGTWRLKAEGTGSPITPYRTVEAADQFYLASDFLNGFATWQPNTCVRNLVIDGNNTAFGGIRIQCAARFRLEHNVIQNTQYVGLSTIGCYEFGIGPMRITAPIGWYLASCESAMQSDAELEIYSFSNAFFVVGNQTLINSVFYPFGGDNNTPAAWYGTMRKNILCQWSLNVKIGDMLLGAGNVGIELYNSNMNFQHLENEFTDTLVFLTRDGSSCVVDGFSSKATCPLASGDSTSKLVIRNPFLLPNGSKSFTALNGETSSTFELHIYDQKILPDPILGTNFLFSTVNNTRLFPFTGQVNLFCSTGGDATIAGLSSSNPTTLDGALTFIEHNPQIKDWLINLIGGQTHAIANAHTLKDQRIEFTTTGGAGLAIINITTSPLVMGSYLWFSFVNLQWTPTAAFTVAGNTQFNFQDSGVTIPASKVIFQCSAQDTARVQAHGYGPTFTYGASCGLCSGNVSGGFVNYEDDFTAVTVVSGTVVLEAVTSGKAKKIASNIV